MSSGISSLTARLAAGVVVGLLVAACGSSSGGGPAQATRANDRRDGAIPPSLLAAARPIGRGPRFQPALAGVPVGACEPQLGRREEVHVELFGANRVVLLSGGIGTTSPRSFLDARLTHAGCFGSIVTLDPTGTVYLRPHLTLTLSALFRAWGHPLSDTRMASFTGTVRVYVDGRRRAEHPGMIRLLDHAEIVLEVGPYVPPHVRFSFPELPPTTLR